MAKYKRGLHTQVSSIFDDLSVPEIENSPASVPKPKDIAAVDAAGVSVEESCIRRGGAVQMSEAGRIRNFLRKILTFLEVRGVSYAKVSLCCVVILFFCSGAYTQSQPGDVNESVVETVGRRDPFEQITPQPDKLSLIKKVFDERQEVEADPELFVETVMLKFLDAKNLQTALANMKTDRGSITADSKNNSLIICDTRENVEKVLAEIRKADTTPKQIMVEVVILDVKLENETDIGVNWDMLSDRLLDITYRQNFTSRLTSTVKDADTLADATAYNSLGGPAGNISVAFGSVRQVVTLLQTKKDVEILASPRVMMVSGQSAYIEAVDEIPYSEQSSTSEGGSLTYTEFKPVGVKLRVSATITDENEILLSVDAEQNVQVGSTAPPRVDTRKAQASLLLKDGQVVIMGGLRRQEKTKTVKQIPLLGDLPIIGELFKSTNEVVNNSELVVFLSPHIHDGEAPSAEEMEKFNEISKRSLLELPDEPTTGDYIEGIGREALGILGE